LKEHITVVPKEICGVSKGDFALNTKHHFAGYSDNGLLTAGWRKNLNHLN
jgi:hypothetical protein